MLPSRSTGHPVTVLWKSVVSGYLVSAIGWRGMFIAEGLPAILRPFCWRRLVQDRPAEAAWLDPRERSELEALIEEEQCLLPPIRNCREAFRSPADIAVAVQYFCWSVGVYGFVQWLPSILRSGAKIGIVETGWLSAAPYLFATLLMIVAPDFSERSGHRKAFVWPFLLVGAVAPACHTA